mgnify:CR=1 FL=1
MTLVTKTSLVDLLTKGRSILAAKEQEAEWLAEERAAKLNAEYDEARAVALKVLAPLGGEFLVSPCVPPAGWRGQTWDGKLTFSVAPFGEEAGTIDVHLRYFGSGWQPEDNT